jgi:hypothetical protein
MTFIDFDLNVNSPLRFIFLIQTFIRSDVISTLISDSPWWWFASCVQVVSVERLGGSRVVNAIVLLIVAAFPLSLKKLLASFTKLGCQLISCVGNVPHCTTT